jgi:hypothetical protein
MNTNVAPGVALLSPSKVTLFNSAQLQANVISPIIYLGTNRVPVFRHDITGSAQQSDMITTDKN